MLHDRWAMLGTLWCLTPKLLHKYTAIDNGASKGVWFKAGAMIFGSDGLNYMVAPVLARAQFIFAVLACQVVVMGAIEAYRVNGSLHVVAEHGEHRQTAGPDLLHLQLGSHTRALLRTGPPTLLIHLR